MVLIGVCIIGIMLAGIISGQGWLIAMAVLVLLVAHCWRNNSVKESRGQP